MTFAPLRPGEWAATEELFRATDGSCRVFDLSVPEAESVKKELTLSQTAREYKGTRWVHHGRDFSGLDCVGLVCVCIERVHGFTPPVPDYLRVTHTEKMLEVCNHMFDLVPLSSIAEDCIAVMGFGRQRHMGIIGRNANGLTLIHAYLPNRRVVEVRLDDAWRSKVIAAYRVQVK